MILLILGLIVFGLSFLFVAITKTLESSRHPEDADGYKIAVKLCRVIGAILVLIGFFMSTIIIVPTGQAAVLMRFGAVTGYLDPGIHLIAPYINSVALTETRTQKEVAQGTASSKDLQTVSAEIAINYHVSSADVAKLYKDVGPDYKSRIIDPAVQESLKQVTAQYTAEELIKKRAQVKSEVEKEITERAKAYGVIIEPLGVSITNFDFSAEFNAAIEQKQVALQTAEKQKYVLQQAVLEKETEITKAEGQAQASKIRALALKTQGGGRVIAEKWIDKWDGVLPVVGSSSGMMLNISDLMKSSEPSAEK
jgi:regulator of protease activity HflC (stomatin/prohibitin superfamily)